LKDKIQDKIIFGDKPSHTEEGVYNFEIKEESLVPSLIYLGPKFSFPEPRVSIPEFAEDYSSYFDSSTIVSPIYSDQFKEENTSFQILPEVSYSPTLKYSSPYYYLANIRHYFPEAIKTLVEQSLEIFYNLHFESHIPSPKSSMPRNIPQGGAQVNTPPPPPPRVFNKVATRYAPLVFPSNLNDIPDNYVKNLPKFNGENDVTIVEHLVFFE
jgi:hypothetical protein